MYSEYYGEVSDYTRKGGVVHSEMLLPSHAPPEYSNRQTLWNAVEKAERSKNAQLAYSFDIALQNEFSIDENIELARQFLSEQFVSRGMIVDFSVHQPEHNVGGNSNPHFHVLCPIRPLDENGQWTAKQRREYLLDSSGNRVKDNAGNYVFNAVPTTDWGKPETLETWREEWANLCNAKFSEKGLDCRIDHRSYERQGIELIPTVHEGTAVRKMESAGIRTNKGERNRQVKAVNRQIKNVLRSIAALTEWLEKYEKKQAEKPTILSTLLCQFYTQRNSGAYSQQAKVNNLKRYAEDVDFLRLKNIFSVEQLRQFVSDTSNAVHDLNESARAKSTRMKDLENAVRSAKDYARLKPIMDAIPSKGGFGKKREKYLSEHDSEIRQFYAAKRNIEKCGLFGARIITKPLQDELKELSAEYATIDGEIVRIYADLKRLRDIQYKIESTQHEQEKHRQRHKNYELE